jgi:AcrR family transcriptional regulator
MTRVDAVRNRQQALDSARAVLAERGLDAPLDEIARRAGIGNATLYRHFPTRCDLIVAVFASSLRELAAISEQALAELDAWVALTGLITSICERCARDRALADLLTTETVHTAELDALRAVPVANMQALIRRAKRQGDLRRDFRDEDVRLILKGNAGLLPRTRDEPDAWRRHLAYVLDGLRARDGRVLVQAVSDIAAPSSAPSARSTEHETHVKVGVSRLV